MAVIRDSATYKPSEKKTIPATTNNSNHALLGFVNKQVEALNYGGGETDSLIINVDNEKNIITGNVKWQAFLGESDNAAYPGDKGADNHNKIMDLFGILNDEIKRAIQSEGVLQFKLDSEISERVSDNRAILSRLYELEDLVNNSIRTDLSILSNRVDKVITDIERNKRLSEEAIAEVASSVRKEEKRATSAESALSNKIEVLEGEVGGKIIALSDEVTQKFNDVHSTISSEVETLRESIDEVSTGLTIDYSSKISAVESSTNEKLDRVNSALDDISDKIEAETVDRQKADSIMNSNMKSIESSLLTVINDKFDGLSPRIDSNAAKINGLQSQMNTSVNQLSDNISITNNRLDLIEPKIEDETKNRKAMDDSIISSLNRGLVENKEYADSLISPVLTEVSEIKEALATLSDEANEDLQDVSNELDVVSVNLDVLTNRLSEEVLVRKSSDEELRNEIARNNTSVQEDITSLRKELLDNKAKDEETLLSISSKFVSIDKVLADTSSTVGEGINQLELQLSEEIQNRISADADISSSIKLSENNLVTYVDTSIETVVSEMRAKDTAIESDLLNQIEIVSTKINTSIKNINSTIDALNNDITEEAYQRALLESSVKSDIATTKIDIIQYVDASVTEIRGEISTSNSSAKQYLLDELSKSTTDLRNSITEINALANNIEAKLKKESEDRQLGDVESVSTASRLVSEMYESVLSKLDALKSYVDDELKSAVEKLDAYDVLLTQKINNEINRAKQSEDLLHNQITEEEAERKTEDLKLDRSINILSAHSEERVLLVRSELMGLISDERIRAELAESSIIERFGTLEEKIAAEFVHRFSEEDPQLRVYSEQNGEVVPIVASMGTYGSTIVMRDANGKISLISGTDELSSFKNSDAVPKLYVDMKASETEDTIMKNVEEAMSFTFIDGGNAPIPKT